MELYYFHFVGVFVVTTANSHLYPMFLFEILGELVSGNFLIERDRLDNKFEEKTEKERQ